MIEDQQDIRKTGSDSSEEPRGLVFDIERFAIHDGPGIRTVVFLKGCNLDCRWCANPESKSVRMEIGYKRDECVHCGRCILACPEKVIQTAPEGIKFETFSRCGDCERCVDICHRNALIRFGTWYDPDSLMDIILRDVAFYDESGGGVTFSGGEPLLQSDFLETMLIRCAERGISTALETAGCMPNQRLARILPMVDYFLMDIKHLDSSVHREYTSQNNEVILDSFRFLSESGKEIIARIPLMPGFNDSEEHLSGLFEFLKPLKGVRSVHFLPYHELGRAKYAWIGQEFESVFTKYTNEEFESKADDIRRIGRVFDMSVTIGGLE